MREQVEKLVEEALAENPKLFLIDLKISPSNSINVVVDGDEGISIKECIRISRNIEHNLDRETTDFSLEVSSPGLSEPIVNNRQFNKNLGKTLKVKTETDTFEGKLLEVNDEGIVLEWKVREPKPVGKGKITVVKKAELQFDSIKQAKVKLKF
ncbi:ribosome assembly cofactor RimP [Aureibaculum sp. 2210JD6-5]|uniref:ribosome assembly cofactor RimP n=1 Tax=Aureibaculum sp. 2210JD6-5 TaxID=3103957 RepID=UPI002AADC965|nr:ribosome assembly cofactor RimP [Aureibaculum sp. 2210JD6-5]MDY7396433.1 ribosome assembly cofactor RimP [Aureibaculum sp. 2210JD6-5]